MRENFIRFVLIITGLVHLIPVVGVLGADKLQKIYGIELIDPNLVLLLRHRALLFFILSLIFLTSAFIGQLRLISYVSAFISMGAFIFLYLTSEGLNDFHQRVFVIDLMTSVILFLGGWLDRFGLQSFLEMIKK